MSTIRYAPHCTRGEIIALLYNRIAQDHSMPLIKPEIAEKLVYKKLGDASTMGRKTVPRQEGYIDELNGVLLNVWCYEDAIDASGYPKGDGEVIIKDLIYKRCRDKVGLDVQSVKWETIES